MKALLQIIKNSIFIHKYDKKGIRIFIDIASSGAYRINIYRKRTITDTSAKSDWQFIYVSNFHSFYSRIEAENEAIKKAKELIRIYNY